MFEYSREFKVLASHLNFTTAARELNESQPNLSRHIGELEQRLGFRLVTRNPVKLTAAGEHYLDGISHIIFETDHLVADCEEIARLDNNELTVSMVRSYNDTVAILAYNTLAKMHDIYPNFSYHFDDSRKLTIERTVTDGIADVGVLYYDGNEIPDGFKLELMYDEPFVPWLHEDNPLAHRPIRFEELSSCALLLSANRKFQTWADGMRCACERYGARPSFRTRDIDGIFDFVTSLQKDEVFFVSAAMSGLELYNPHLRRGTFAESTRYTYPVYLLYRDPSPNPALESFLELFRDAVARRPLAGQEKN